MSIQVGSGGEVRVSINECFIHLINYSPIAIGRTLVIMTRSHYLKKQDPWHPPGFIKIRETNFWIYPLTFGSRSCKQIHIWYFLVLTHKFVIKIEDYPRIHNNCINDLSRPLCLHFNPQSSPSPSSSLYSSLRKGLGQKNVVNMPGTGRKWNYKVIF